MDRIGERPSSSNRAAQCVFPGLDASARRAFPRLRYRRDDLSTAFGWMSSSRKPGIAPRRDIVGPEEMNLAGRERRARIDRTLACLQRSDDMARRLATIPGIGPVGATALAASVTDPGQFRSGRQFAAWLGLTPLQNSSGGKERLGRITKMGDKYLRKLLVIGATSLVASQAQAKRALKPQQV